MKPTKEQIIEIAKKLNYVKLEPSGKYKEYGILPESFGQLADEILALYSESYPKEFVEFMFNKQQIFDYTMGEWISNLDYAYSYWQQNINKSEL